LNIKGDSELVIKQLKGEYQVNDDILKNYHLIVKGLLEVLLRSISVRAIYTGNVGHLRLLHIPREENVTADSLAKQAAGRSVKPILRYFHHPCLDRLWDGKVEGVNGSFNIKVAHDLGAACHAPQVYVDATFLRMINGEKGLKSVKSAGKKILIEGKTPMTVIGMTTVQFTFGMGEIIVDNALVVDYLPWQLQVSVKHPACPLNKVPGVIGGSVGWRSQVPRFHQSHPYWESNVCVLGG
jgi:hypothetical protein